MYLVASKRHDVHGDVKDSETKNLHFFFRLNYKNIKEKAT